MRHMIRYYILFDSRAHPEWAPLSGRSFRVEASVGHLKLVEAVLMLQITLSLWSI